jgi:hypothetical protein
LETGAADCREAKAKAIADIKLDVLPTTLMVEFIDI